MPELELLPLSDSNSSSGAVKGEKLPGSGSFSRSEMVDRHFLPYLVEGKRGKGTGKGRSEGRGRGKG